MEESDENISVWEVDSIEECDSLQFTSHNNISKTNFQYDSSLFKLDNESLMIAEEYEIDVPENKIQK